MVAEQRRASRGRSVGVVAGRLAGRRAGRPRYLFTLSHPPLAPLSTTHEQMVHSRRRVIESPRRKCNCSSNYVIAATEQWESLRPQLFIGPREGVSSSEGLKTWTRRLCARLSPSCEVVKKKPKKQPGDQNNCSRHPTHLKPDKQQMKAPPKKPGFFACVVVWNSPCMTSWLASSEDALCSAPHKWIFTQTDWRQKSLIRRHQW